MKSLINTMLAVAVVIMVLMAIVMGFGGETDIVTMDGFSQLKVGMTYKQVFKIIGEQGKATTEKAHFLFLGLGQKMYEWEKANNYVWSNSDGTGIMLTFDKNNVLINKNKSGLDTPGMMNLKLDFNEQGKIINRQEIEAVFGPEKTSQYLKWYSVVSEEKPTEKTEIDDEPEDQEPDDAALP